ATIAIANGRVIVNEEVIYIVQDAKAGTFLDIAYCDYPDPIAKNARGGRLGRS
ncbi:MAG: bifunctional 3-hydroxydecanoyl-ACP dehydratase/trans-2-decenoyl-ACP isomerase, partial [Oligoflexales bacterium]|nr:bifunctional 3-hydroxydecanoyl-ACP dehydratase/trans-2-decenoyl-ACP isomerase [Oligoflexales bacterium]